MARIARDLHEIIGRQTSKCFGAASHYCTELSEVRQVVATLLSVLDR